MTGGTFGDGARRAPAGRHVRLLARDHAGRLMGAAFFTTREAAAYDAARWMARGDVGGVEVIGGEVAPCVVCGAYAPEHDDGCPVMTGEH